MEQTRQSKGGQETGTTTAGLLNNHQLGAAARAVHGQENGTGGGVQEALSPHRREPGNQRFRGGDAEILVGVHLDIPGCDMCIENPPHLLVVGGVYHPLRNGVDQAVVSHAVRMACRVADGTLDERQVLAPVKATCMPESQKLMVQDALDKETSGNAA